MSGKRTNLTLKERLKILKEYKDNSKTDISKKYKCSISTINRIIQNEKQIFNQAQKNKLTQKRRRSGACEPVERALLVWFNQAREKNAQISSNVIMEKGKQFAIQFNLDFTPTGGWLYRWQKRENIKLRKIVGEGASADIENANAYENVLPNLLLNYKQSDIFNADETGLFYRALPNKILNKNGCAVKGYKLSKDRLTILFICNATGDYKKAIIIGKPKNPRCFKNKVLPLKYYSQGKAWMTKDLWTQIILELDKEMCNQKRQIILFVDNAAPHNIKAVLKNINIQFLPPNTTSLSQPLDQGIIHCFKSYYRQSIISKQISFIDMGKPTKDFPKSINILNTMHMVNRSWWMVSPTTIQNCFKKCKFIKPSQTEEVIIEVENFNNDCSIYHEDFETFVECDDNLSCHGDLSESEIVNEILNKENTSDSFENVELSDEEEGILPTKHDILTSINNLRKYFQPKNKFMKELDDMELEMVVGANSMQSKITHFFENLNF